MKLGARLRIYHGVIFEFMREHELTNEDMAYLCGISSATFSLVLTLKHRASQRTAELIAEVIECTPEEIRAGFVHKDIPRIVETVREYSPRAIEDWAERYRARALTFGKPDASIEVREEVERLLACVSERQRKIITAHFLEGLTFAEIGRRFNLSRERVRQIELAALRMMDKASRNLDAKEALRNLGYVPIEDDDE
jgi:DNA-directed RNA polymerase specialized sigma subunit